MKDNQFYEISDAFLALKDIDDDAVEGMLRESRKAKEAYIHEGKAFSIQAGSKDMQAAREFLEEDAENGDQIEVIDVDADTVDHIKKNSEYVGQGILSCNRCKANRFIDMDLLVASEADEELFNVDDECPHCHDAGAGYTLIGQVGKVQKDEPAEASEEPAALENDEAPEEATFDNDAAEESDAESEEEAEATPAEDEEPDVDVFSDDEEDDGMETTTSEDELDDLDLPALGDEVNSDETEEDEDNVKESLQEAVQMNAMAEEAWMMNRVISSMNNEDAYYGSWLYLWPDGETQEECAYDFGDRESFEELKDKFIRTYKHYHSDGLYAAAPEVVEYAHMMDERLGLAKIENLEPVKPHVREALECSVAGDILKSITSPEKIDKIVIIDVSDEEGEPREIFKGSREDCPMNAIASPCKSFDVADGYLSCNIDSDVENTNRPLSKALECFSDDKTDKVLVWDQAKSEEVFSGTKAEACDRFGNCEFISFETPAVIRISINNPGILSSKELEDETVETDVDKLVKKIIDANNLSQYKTDKPNTNEYWIKACLEDMDDVELIYESFVKPTENKELIKEFKAVTGYNNALEEAYEAGFAAASVDVAVNEDKETVTKFAKFVADKTEKAHGIPKDLESADADQCSNCGGDLLPVDADGVRKCQSCGNQYVAEQPIFCPQCGGDVDTKRDCKCKSCGYEFLNDSQCPKCGGEVSDGKCNHCGSDVVTEEVDTDVQEAFMSRDAMIDELEDLGVHYNFDRFDDRQIYRMLEKERVKAAKMADMKAAEAETPLPSTCDECGARLNDGGTCPVCDHGEEQLEALDKPVTLDTVKAEVDSVETPEADKEDKEDDKQLKEVVKSFKTRKELAEAVSDCKNNSRPYTIRRSETEGYRYDLITEEVAEEVDEEELTSLVPAETGAIEVVDDIPQEMPTEYSPQQRQLMDNIHRVAIDISDAIQRHYDIEADPQLIVADIIRDLQLISGDVSVDDLGDSAADRATKDLFSSYNEFYAFVDELISAESGTTFVSTPESKLRQAIQAINGPSFSHENINKMIASRAFIAAARGGNVPYIAASDIPLLEALDQMLDESVEVDTEIFDEEMNSYFNESYEDTVVYTTTEGHVNEDGTIVLEGILQLEEVVKPITFTLTPDTKITEDVEDRDAAFENLMSETFTVTNNISEEVFEFKFSN